VVKAGDVGRLAVSSALTRDSTFKLLFHIVPRRNEREMTFLLLALLYFHCEIKKKRQI